MKGAATGGAAGGGEDAGLRQASGPGQDAGLAGGSDSARGCPPGGAGGGRLPHQTQRPTPRVIAAEKKKHTKGNLLGHS